MKRRRDKDLVSFQNQLCSTGDELLQYKYGSIDPEKRSQIFYHLNIEKCKRCRELFHSLKEPAEEVIPSRIPELILEKVKGQKDTPVIHITRQRLERGQFWTTIPTPKNMHGEIVCTVPMGVPVFIIRAGNGERNLNNIIRVIPISFDVDYYFEEHTLALNESSPLAFPILLEIFNERPMFAGNLGEYRGSVSPEDMVKIEEARKTYQHNEISRPNKEILEWMQKEIKLTEYLTFPVNEGLWEEETDEEEIEIFLEPYRKAADTTGLELSEIKTHLLMDKDEFSICIIQKRDQLLLRYTSDTIEPQYIEINGEKKDMVNLGSGIFEALLGEVNTIPESLELKVAVKGEEFSLRVQFKKKNET